jgi:Raf kinase inhibitor-like YbhB/YbcL family protein
MKTFTVRSEELGGQFTTDQLYNDWGAGGKNISPHLKWENAPAETKCFAVTMYDASAPTGSGWWHWILFNIPSTVDQLLAGAGSTLPEFLPKGAVSSLTDFAKPGYGGPVPMPGSGFHPYVITVHALSHPLELDDTANPALVGFQMSPLTIAKASLMVYLHV